MQLFPRDEDTASTSDASREPLDQALRLVRGDEAAGAGPAGARWRRFGSELIASGFVHLAVIAVLIFIGLREAAVTPPAPAAEPDAVPMTFVQPQPIAPPVPLSHAKPPAAQAPAPPAVSPDALRPIEPPLGALPEPNRMGEQVPIPPPPKDSRGGTPTEPSPGPRDAEEGKQALAQRGAPDATPLTGSPDRPLENGPAAAGPEGGSSPLAEGTHSPIVVPSNPSTAPPGSVPGAGGGGVAPRGTSRRPQRRGLELGVPYDTGAFANFSFEHSDYDWSDYWSVMYWAIWRKWHERLYLSLLAFEREALARGEPGLDGTALIRFTIERNGNVSKVELLTASGIKDLDLSSSDAIREADLPPLPSDFPHPQERVTGSFKLEVGDVRDMRQSLTSMRARGQF